MKIFTVYWNDGTTTDIQGETIQDAWDKAGYNADDSYTRNLKTWEEKEG